MHTTEPVIVLCALVSDDVVWSGSRAATQDGEARCRQDVEMALFATQPVTNTDGEHNTKTFS